MARLGAAAIALLAVTVALSVAGCSSAPVAGSTSTSAPEVSTTAPEEPTTSTTAALTEARRLAPESGRFSTCPDCHALLDLSGAKRPALVDAFRHEAHLDRAAPCETCHAPPIHSDSGTRRPAMSACFTCHGAESTSVAPSDCALCHPPGFSLKPASHDQAFFSGGHARVAEVQGTDDCFLCHTGGKEDFCQACHGLDMPHPGGWALDAGGGPGAHVATAHQDATICVRCHDNSGATPQGCFGGECHGS